MFKNRNENIFTFFWKKTLAIIYGMPYNESVKKRGNKYDKGTNAKLLQRRKGRI